MADSQTAYSPTLDQGSISALVAGRHSDTFSLLGLHTQPQGRGLVLRALLPNAESVTVVCTRTGRTLGKMHAIDPVGLFELPLPQRTRRFGYRYEVCWDGQLYQETDPYSVGELLTPQQHYLFAEGSDERAYRWMGAHRRNVGGVEGTHFVVWAPAATRVSVVGDFNGWDGRRHVMRHNTSSGIWDIFLPGVRSGQLYKYEILDAKGQRLPLKSDPYGRAFEHPPNTASQVAPASQHVWRDSDWLAQRASAQDFDKPISIYEVHLGSWRRVREEGNRYLSYRELAQELIPYVCSLGFTHIQLLPVSEYPYDGSWGYQPIGLFAPSIRYGAADEFRHFVDSCHQAGLGVLLDWVPGHFPSDEHGLGRFDGSALYEHEDPRQGYHPDWNTLIYNYGRKEVLSYLLSNAFYWFDEYHIDGLRVDAVASMLYLDYSRKSGGWIPNAEGGRENLEAIKMLQTVNSRISFNYPGALMIAEESTSFWGVTKPVDQGGLGFHYKWNMGWMNDTLSYFASDPLFRKYHQEKLTFGLIYAFSENFVLPLSHDEVVHGKRSLVSKMPGDEWRRFANLRAYLSLMWTHPGKKLLFMGGEFAQLHEWDYNSELDWLLLEQPAHRGVSRLVQALNLQLSSTPALYEQDVAQAGFEWLQLDNVEQSILVWLRRDASGAVVIVTANLTPNLHTAYRFGVPAGERLIERFNSDEISYGGSGQRNSDPICVEAVAADGRSHSVRLLLAPLAVQIFELQS